MANSSHSIDQGRRSNTLFEDGPNLSLRQTLDLSLLRLPSSVRTIVRSGLEESTWTQYGKHVDLYRTFLEDPQESGATSDERHMLRFAGKLFEQGMQPRTITSVWAGVARYRDLRQWPQLGLGSSETPEHTLIPTIIILLYDDLYNICSFVLL